MTEPTTDPLVAWSTEDKAWLEAFVPTELRQIALRYGREIYTLCMHVGAVEYALNHCAQNMKRTSKNVKAILVMQGVFNEVLTMAVGDRVELLHQCKGDIETAAALSNGAVLGGRISPAGIILDS